MANRTVPDLKEIFKQAAEIAGHLPENMQVAGFNRAVDLLTGSITATDESVTKSASRAKPSRRANHSDGAAANKPRPALASETLADAIDSTRHPAVRSASKVLDRALMVLQIALLEHGVDGLYPGDIARILTNKFRLNTNDSAVRMSLGNATNLVNRVQIGKGFVYRIMGPGEEYLAHLGEADPDRDATAARGRRRTRKKVPTQRQQKVVAAGNVTDVPAKKSTNRSKAPAKSPIGPKSAIVSLVASGFFDVARNGPAVQEYLRTKRGYALGMDQLRLAMLRLVRDGVLERSENDNGHYEYKKP